MVNYTLFLTHLRGWLYFLCALAGWSSYAQTGQPVTLTGRVTDVATHQPLPFASVYIDATTQGTTTDEQGHYRLSTVSVGTVVLLASYVGYTTAKQTLRLENTQPRVVDFALTANAQLLADITVKAGKDKTWQRQFRQFERELLGSFSDQCTITNSEVVQFEEKGGHLLATATKPLLINNEALGYRLRYELQNFDSFQGTIYYGGTSQFSQLTPKTPRQTDQWHRNRLRAYYGSLRHLLTSLASGTHEQAGFLIYRANPKQPITSTPPMLTVEINKHLKTFDAKQAVITAGLPTERWLRADMPLEIFYTKITARNSPYHDAPYAYSQLILPQGSMGITTNGLVNTSRGFKLLGYLNNDRLANSLPTDWQPDDRPIADKLASLNQPITEGILLEADAQLNRLTTNWNVHHDRQPPAVFVHIDKPLYVTGDDLWLSAYLPDARTHLLEKRASEPALQVELWSPANRMVQHQWLLAKEGRAAGNFRLDDSLTTGVYHLRAYTDADCQNGQPAFERPIILKNWADKGIQSLTSSEPTDSIDVQFLPEGGRWVVGLPARLGIKAIGTDGRGRMVKGRIITNDGQEVIRFETNRLGMGNISLPNVPDAAHPYRAEVTSPSGQIVVRMPIAETQGMVLAADLLPDSSQLMLSIRASDHYANQALYVVVQSRGQLIYKTKLRLRNQRAQLAVATAQLPPGLGQVALFDSLGNAWAERLIYIPEKMAPVAMAITADKPRYQPHERITVTLKLTDGLGSPIKGYMSTSVTDASLLPPDTSAADGRTHLLLTGDLRGYVEDPNFYLQAHQPGRARALDNLLLTQGWRRVGWGPSAQLTSSDDTLGSIVLRGQLVDALLNPIPTVAGSLMSIDPGKPFLSSIETDQQGRFAVGGLTWQDTVRLLVQLKDQLKKPIRATILFDGASRSFSAFRKALVVDWSAFQPMIKAAQIRQEANEGYYRQKSARQLQEVVVKVTRSVDERPDDIRRRSLHNQVSKTVVLDGKMASAYANLYMLLAAKLSGVSVDYIAKDNAYSVSLFASNKASGLANSANSESGSKTAFQNPLFLMDGVPIVDTDGTQLMSFSPTDIERVELIKDGSMAAIYGTQGARGIIAFYSRVIRAEKAGSGRVIPYELVGYASQREFYVPRYEVIQPDDTAKPDYRDVLYWKPLMMTDAQGVSTLTFPLSDKAKALRLTVQGITQDGQPVSGSQLIQVRD